MWGYVFKWCFPELFVISRDKDAFVADIMSFPNGIIHWDLRFSKNVQDWELESMTNFMELIYLLQLRGNREDKLCWQNKTNKGFSVKEHYRCACSPSIGVFPLEDYLEGQGST